LTTAASSLIQRRVPGPRGNIFYGITRELRRDPLGLYMQSTIEFGDLVRFQALPTIHWYLATHPSDVEHVLYGNQQNYIKGDFFTQRVGVLVGKGLLTSEGDFWRRQRRLSQPAFHRQYLAGLGATMVSATEDMAERWHIRAKGGQPFDIALEMMRLTLRIASLTLFSTDISSETETVGPALRTAFEHVGFLLVHPFALSLNLPTARNLRFRQAKRVLDRVVYKIIDQRRRSGKDAGDLLSMLLLARDEETGGGMNDEQLRDEVLTLFIAGHETTAVALSWTFYLLALNPDADHKLRAELDRVLCGRSPSVDDLPNLRYTRMVLEESMRLYPPAWALPRQAIEDDVLGGYHIPAGSMVDISQYVTHRRPDLWEDPEKFDPERFTPEQSANRPRFAYYPFGGGARTCIGNNFAMMEAQLILATIAQRFRFQLVREHPIVPDPTFVLKPRYGVMMKIESTH
jgi:cytochrome P450